MRSSMLVELGAALLLSANLALAEDPEPAAPEAPPLEVREPVPGEVPSSGETVPGEAVVAPAAESDAALEAEADAAEAASGSGAPEDVEPALAEPEPPADAEAASASPAPEAAEPSPAEPEAAASEPAETETVSAPSEPEAPASAVAEEPEVAENGVRMGQVGYDSEGRPGRIHVVVRGDTLWDISEAYLGTPWVWPSVWQDNRNIENPHRIYPGDRIWITDSVMRVVTPEEAEALLAGTPAAAEPAPFTEVEDPIGLDEAAPAPPLAEPRTQRVSTREGAGFVAADAYEAAASIVDGLPEKIMLSQGDRVYIGLGAGDVAPGDRFTVFRMRERVFDPDTGRLLGYHVDLLGWVEVEEPGAEASLALVRESPSEIERGDRLVPREQPLPEIAVLPAPQGVEAKVSFFARSRTMMGMSDYVYLNRGTLDGVEVGSPLEVYRPAYVANEVARGTKVEVPDRVIAQLLVVKAETNTAVAFVTHTATEIELGDHVRGATR